MKILSFSSLFLFSISTFAQTGNVGIGTTNPQAQLHTTGSVRHETLKAEGLKLVYSNVNGDLLHKGQYKNTTSVHISEGACGGSTSFINVNHQPAQVSSGDIKVNIDIDCLHTSQFSVVLIAPTGQVLMLVKNTDASAGSNFRNTAFSDQSTLSISQGYAPYTRTFRPSGSLSTFCFTNPSVASFAALGSQGLISPNGIWYLKVIDHVQSNPSALKSWAISFDGSYPGNEFLFVDRIGIQNEEPNAPLQFRNEAVNRKIVLFQTLNNEHQFYGFGVNGGLLRYQVDHAGADHVFYAGNDEATSTELMRIKGTGQIGIGTPEPTSMLSVNGTADKAGGGNWGTFSDSRVKKNIHTYHSGLNEILKINPVTFQYNHLSGYTDTTKLYVGVIAQEIEKVLPSTVTSLKNDPVIENKRVYDSSELIYTLINAVKEQQILIENLRLEMTRNKQVGSISGK